MSSLQFEEKGDILVAYFSDAKILDDARIQQIGKDLLEGVQKATSRKLLLNFQTVTFMSSAMIGKIILVNKKCKGEEVDLGLCCISPNVMEVFKLMRLHKILKIYRDEESALKKMGGGGGWFG